jgi:DNA modification methylase
MSTVGEKAFDLCLTDPPYGIGWKGCICKDGIQWDAAIPSKAYFDEMFRVSTNQIIWGGNYFIDYLKNTRCVIVWKKTTINKGMTFAPLEIAWTSFDRNAAYVEYGPPGARGWWSMPTDAVRYHPAQKPLALMKYCLNNYAEAGALVLDPFMGSGTTGVACVSTGRRFIGIESERRYFDIACRRIKEAVYAEARQGAVLF